MIANIDDAFTKKLKDKCKESVYIEQDNDKVFFTNSCWEI